MYILGTHHIQAGSKHNLWGWL